MQIIDPSVAHSFSSCIACFMCCLWGSFFARVVLFLCLGRAFLPVWRVTLCVVFLVGRGKNWKRGVFFKPGHPVLHFLLSLSLSLFSSLVERDGEHEGRYVFLKQFSNYLHFFNWSTCFFAHLFVVIWPDLVDCPYYTHNLSRPDRLYIHPNMQLIHLFSCSSCKFTLHKIICPGYNHLQHTTRGSTPFSLVTSPPPTCN